MKTARRTAALQWRGMRARALAVVALVAAALGAAAVLVVGTAAGWIGDDDGTRARSSFATAAGDDGRRP